MEVAPLLHAAAAAVLARIVSMIINARFGKPVTNQAIKYISIS